MEIPMFGRKKTAEKPAEITKPAIPGTEATRDFSTALGEGLTRLVADGPTSADLIDAVDRLNKTEMQPSDKPRWDTHAAATNLDGIEQAVAEAKREVDPPEGANEPGPEPEKAQSLIESFAASYNTNLENLRTAEQNLVERMARRLDDYEAQRDADAEELRQMRVTIEATEAAVAVIGMSAPTPPSTEPKPRAKTRADRAALDAAAGSRAPIRRANHKASSPSAPQQLSDGNQA